MSNALAPVLPSPAASDAPRGSRLERVDISLIRHHNRLRQADPKQVKALAASIAEAGLIHAITVTETQVLRGGIAVDGYKLVSGLHRLEAVKDLGWTEIEAIIVDMPELIQQLVEVDENLLGTVLTPAERAKFTARRKDIYIALHPETRNGENQHTRVRKLCEPTPDRFTSDTAKKTGVSERKVQLDARRGERIDSDVLSQVTGTDLDTGRTLDILASVPKDEQPMKVEELRDARVAPIPKVRTPAPPASGASFLDLLAAHLTWLNVECDTSVESGDRSHEASNEQVAERVYDIIKAIKLRLDGPGRIPRTGRADKHAGWDRILSSCRYLATPALHRHGEAQEDGYPASTGVSSSPASGRGLGPLQDTPRPITTCQP